MTRYVVLFRGVGGATQLPVKPLRSALEEAGFEEVATYINSGNAVVTSGLGRGEVVARIGAICAREFHFNKAVHARTSGEWAALIANNPFPDAAAAPRWLHAALLDGDPDPERVAALRALSFRGEQIEVIGRVAYLRTPGGFGASKLAKKFDKGIGVPNTARNWNTVLKLMALAAPRPREGTDGSCEERRPAGTSLRLPRFGLLEVAREAVMTVQIPVSSAAEVGKEGDDKAVEIAPDIAYLRTGIANVVFLGRPGAGDRGWLLVDAGVAGYRNAIAETGARRFGEGARPAAILMTHGHFDHVGALEALSEEWDAPVFAHPLEHGFLNGGESYPPPDPWVGGGLMALLSPLFPRAPVDVGNRLRAFPEDGTIPGLPDWRWIHTPGHTPGHVSLWRESDRTVVAGDAFITTGQESAYEVILQKPEMHGPPRYFTPDWRAAGESVAALARLHPDLAVTGHGPALRGEEMRQALHRLAREFDQIAVPDHAKNSGKTGPEDMA